jgi:hypothetical protein
MSPYILYLQSLAFSTIAVFKPFPVTIFVTTYHDSVVLQSNLFLS